LFGGEYQNKERALAGLQEAEQDSIDEKIETLSISRQLCVMINSLHSLQEQYEQFVSDLTDITETTKEDEEKYIPPELEVCLVYIDRKRKGEGGGRLGRMLGNKGGRRVRKNTNTHENTIFVFRLGFRNVGNRKKALRG
tara:strand:- start:232 stop:648 length:417 start_codon:yes stop_codon:yes gene_type:complete